VISVRLKKFLDDNLIGFDVVQHDPAFTAQELAARMHVPGREFVKVVVIKMDGKYALAALPAHRRVDLKSLARAAGVRKCSLAGEKEFQDLFPDCDVGAMPPFGNLYDLPTYVDQEVAYNEVIVINAGTHAEAIRIRFADVRRLVRPRIGRFAVPPPIEIAARRRKQSSRKKKKAARRKKALRRKKPSRGKKVPRKKKKKAAKKRPARRKKKPARGKAAKRKKTRPRPARRKKTVRRKKTSKKKSRRGRRR